MVLVILIQGGNAGGVGAAFGGGNSSGLFGASGANKLLTRLTYIVAGIFMLTSISLTVIQGRAAKTGLLQKLESTNAAPASTPVTTPAATQATNPTPIDAAAQPQSPPVGESPTAAPATTNSPQPGTTTPAPSSN